MSNERLVELLSAKADGDLAPGESAELETLLATRPGARQMAEQFARLDAMLAALPEREPPPGLVKRIVAGARLPGNPAKSSARYPWHTLLAPPVLGYGLAAAAGAIIVMALYESNPTMLQVPDITQVVGTLSPKAGDRHALLDSYLFEAEGVSSVARIVRRDDALVLDVRIQADRPFHVHIDLGDQGLSFAALVQAPGGTDADQQRIQMASRHLSIDGQGHQVVVALLQQGGEVPPDAALRLAFSSDGVALGTGLLRLGGENP